MSTLFYFTPVLRSVPDTVTTNRHLVCLASVGAACLLCFVCFVSKTTGCKADCPAGTRKDLRPVLRWLFLLSPVLYHYSTLNNRHMLISPAMSCQAFTTAKDSPHVEKLHWEIRGTCDMRVAFGRRNRLRRSEGFISVSKGLTHLYSLLRRAKWRCRCALISTHFAPTSLMDQINQTLQSLNSVL